MFRSATYVIVIPAALGLLTTTIAGSAIASPGASRSTLGLRSAGVGISLPPRPIGTATSASAVVRVAESSLEDRVAEVQRMLKRQGFNAGPVDGKLGLRTRDAIRAYQSLVRAKEGAVSPDAAETLSREKGPPTPRAKPAIDQ